MATAFDLGMGGGVHPGTKLEVGLRMASVMHVVAYGADEVHQGPSPSEAAFADGKVTIAFDMHKSQGWDVHLGQNCSYSRHGGTPNVLPSYYCKGYEVQDATGLWQDASFDRVNDANVIITSPVVSPVAVRYGWSDYPVVNLYNKEGFPVPPFHMNISASEHIAMV